MFNLYQIGFHYSGHKLVGEVPVCDTCIKGQPNLEAVFQMIAQTEQLGAAGERMIYLMDIARTRGTYGGESYPVQATQSFVQAAHIIAWFGIDADERDCYVLVEEESPDNCPTVAATAAREEILERLDAISRDLAAVRMSVEGNSPTY